MYLLTRQYVLICRRSFQYTYILNAARIVQRYDCVETHYHCLSKLHLYVTSSYGHLHVLVRLGRSGGYSRFCTPVRGIQKHERDSHETAM